MSKKDFKQTLDRLVATFDRNYFDYKSRVSNFNEAQLRQQFLNPMFEALGWDMQNKVGAAEYNKEVIHESKIYIKGKAKAPDYEFRYWDKTKFFVEAKQPFVKIETDIDAAYQLRRYAWSAKLPVSILTDFEEFAIYDTTVKPSEHDKASVARIALYNYNDYSKVWEEIYNTFAKESIIQGSFDKFAAKEKRGKQLVDKDFLKLIQSWREWLAKDLAQNNNNLSVYELNTAVQKIIDRIIFLRIAEDRGIEDYKTLENIITSKNSYKELVNYFGKSYEKYDSSLFDPKDDAGLTARVNVSDKVLDNMLEYLYHPKSPYEFSVMGVEILGNIYEQFLGQVIRLTPSHRALVEDKPEVKKAGGVYYTPQYIVEYIVKNTVGELVKRKTPKDVSKLRILDPACGSGSFLIGAYEYLLDWHTKYYGKLDESEKKKLEKKGVIYKYEDSWHLTTNEKKKIMLNNIYGVDIDHQAVEVTKLSLALKMMENENRETLSQQYKIFADRILPDLSNNIKCGNSLIGSDYWDNKDITKVSEEEIKKVNAFDWEDEEKGFGKIMKQGGFSAVIGNPPYVKEDVDRNAFRFKESRLGKYYQGKMDLWYVFTCLSIDLLKNNGLHAFIAPNNWTTSDGAKIFRQKVANQVRLRYYVDFVDYKVFDTASIQTMVYVMQKAKPVKGYKSNILRIKGNDFTAQEIYGALLNERQMKFVFNFFESNLDYDPHTTNINIVDTTAFNILKHIVKLDTDFLNQSEVHSGIDVLQDYVSKRHLSKLKDVTVGEGIFVLKNEEIALMNLNVAERIILKPYYEPRDLLSFSAIPKTTKWIIYADGQFKENISSYPNLRKHLDKYKSVLTSIYKPYGLHRSREEYLFKGDKLLSVRKTIRPNFIFTDKDSYVARGFMIIKTDRFDYKYLECIFNSKIYYYYLRNKGKLQGQQLQIDRSQIISFPIVYNTDKLNVFLSISNNLRSISAELDSTENIGKKSIYKKRLKLFKDKLNVEVYSLYGLTQKEINIIEESTKEK